MPGNYYMQDLLKRLANALLTPNNYDQNLVNELMKFADEDILIKTAGEILAKNLKEVNKQ
jgi:undecaprenyl pyrophosphate synthase